MMACFSQLGQNSVGDKGESRTEFCKNHW